MDPKLVVGKPKRQVPEPQEFTWVVVGPVVFIVLLQWGTE